MSAAPLLVYPAPKTSGTWLEPLPHWPTTALRCLETTDAIVRVVIASVRGSSPREVGTCMLVDREHIYGTIGGGQLEWSAITTARTLLGQTTTASVQLDQKILGPQLSQCCGGAVELWIERLTHSDITMLRAAEGATSLATLVRDGNVERRLNPVLPFKHSDQQALLIRDDASITLFERLDRRLPQLWLYGAGHVGQALVRVLATLPVQVVWVDSRAELLPEAFSDSMRTLHTMDPVATVAEAPKNAHFLVMTHSHPLDYSLCKAALERNDHAWIGVIGSKSKSIRFRSRLLRDGLDREQVDRLICPIGISNINNKQPTVIAVSVAAQLLQTFDVTSRPSKTTAQHCVQDGCQKCSLQPGATS